LFVEFAFRTLLDPLRKCPTLLVLFLPMLLLLVLSLNFQYHSHRE